MAERLTLSNDYPHGYVFDDRFVTAFPAAGNFTADATVLAFVVPPGVTGTLKSVNIVVGQNAVDVTNPATLTLAVTKNGTSVFTTAPVISKTAGAGVKNTFAAGTGITLPVLDATTVALAAGDVIKVLFDVTRTASPGTEFADVAAIIVWRPEARTTAPV